PPASPAPAPDPPRPAPDPGGAGPRGSAPGGGGRGGTVVGESDPLGGEPKSDRQTPENMAATIYHALGLPPTVTWSDQLDRPHQVYHADPIWGLL
ncbi:MAG: DUF1501 domain-containing protein, partial [Planctomycetaceae bacterium]